VDFRETVQSRYRTTYDRKTGAFLILDCWHESVRNIQDIENATIPETSPALTVITQEQANSLIDAQIKLGWFDKIKEQGEVKTSNSPRPSSIQEVAINKIENITINTNEHGVNEQVAKEAIQAIRTIAKGD